MKPLNGSNIYPNYLNSEFFSLHCSLKEFSMICITDNAGKFSSKPRSETFAVPVQRENLAHILFSLHLPFNQWVNLKVGESKLELIIYV